MSKYGVFSGPYFPVFSPNTGKCRLEKTLYLDTFYTVYVSANPRFLSEKFMKSYTVSTSNPRTTSVCFLCSKPSQVPRKHYPYPFHVMHKTNLIDIVPYTVFSYLLSWWSPFRTRIFHKIVSSIGTINHEGIVHWGLYAFFIEAIFYGSHKPCFFHWGYV